MMHRTNVGAARCRKIQEASSGEARLRLLSKLAALSHKRDDLPEAIAELAIPELADWCLVDRVVDGRVQRRTVAHSDPAAAALASDLLRLDADAPGPAIGSRPGATLRAVLADESEIRERDPQLGEAMERLGATSALIVPVLMLEETVAVATFVFAPGSARRHDGEHIALARELAICVGQILQNAQLHERIEELAQAVVIRDRLMGILGHDLRNPLSAVLGLAAVLRRAQGVPDRVREGLDHIAQSARRMHELIGTLMDVTRLRFRDEMPPLAPEDVALDDIAGAIVEELRVAHQGRTIEIASEPGVRGRWDVVRLGQVISNLVGNALEHGAPNAPVEVSVRRDDGGAMLSVTNRGSTVPAETCQHLFEPFWQPPETTTRTGLGLGLFISREIVDAHGGTIDVRSCEGVTTFTVRLPVAA